jgi:AraC-like DNA-binding protein
MPTDSLPANPASAFETSSSRLPRAPASLAPGPRARNGREESAAGSRVGARVRGGLAAWQQRIVVTYIEEHLAEPISLATLAQLVRLSSYHFSHAFKQSFGTPPHRYHNGRRIERAKTLLAEPAPSVTKIGLILGFSQTSSFTATFRKTTGLTPTAYHRSLG